ncbi:TolC family protein [Flavobacterium sp. CYK-4]|uniref:TolC family protein n=1 Tax=Flavobacterium lotistagni TaxID=2709660 RepID=UPI00140CBAAC|nr:TolC family protein [Flavobacterium lotistagni]NHM08137.1 TolC family protein [Flavobacterium lotistagni]
MKNWLLILLLSSLPGWAQTENPTVLPFAEFLGYVKKYHPMVRNAGLEVSMAEANLMKARGGFDPKLEADFSQKQFKDKEYYSLLNGTFKIPTWYGIEAKAGFENNDGLFLDPQNTVPNNGLASFGVSVPLGQGLLINQRMADLRKAKTYLKLSQDEQKLRAVAVIHEASLAYFKWKRSFDEVQLYSEYLTVAENRFRGIKSLIEQGDKPAIDSIEARIIVSNRLVSLEDSKLKLNKAALELSNFLWLDNAIPLELAETVQPEKALANSIATTLRTEELLQNEPTIANHPKINVLERKIELLTIDKKLKSNALLPRIDLGYSYLAVPDSMSAYGLKDYKVGVNFAFPLFLRKERGDLKMAKLKLQESQFNLSLEKLELSNKIASQRIAVKSLEKQKKLIESLVADTETLVNSETRLFEFGESSMFLLNSRENSLISTQLSQITLENQLLISHADLYQTMANPGG